MDAGVTLEPTSALLTLAVVIRVLQNRSRLVDAESFERVLALIKAIRLRSVCSSRAEASLETAELLALIEVTRLCCV